MRATMKYPDTWPKPDTHIDKLSLRNRITEQQKEDLYHRRVTTRDLAEDLGVHETWLSANFPGKIERPDRSKLLEARKEYKLALAKEVLLGKYNLNQAANIANCSYNTMARFLARAKKLHPELVERFYEHVAAARERRKPLGTSDSPGA